MKFFLMITVFFSSLALADSPLTKIEGEDLVCEDSGAKIAVDLGQNGDLKTVRLWQAEQGDTEGLELKVTKFSVFRCPNCYSLEADLVVLGQTVSSLFDVSGVGVDGKIIMAISVKDDDGQWKHVEDINCQKK